MQFRSLNATFGKLERCTLALAPGLNLIEAPNEAGKSTLAAFVRAMLYGLPARERGAAAEKNKYAPWSGSAMQGQLELLLDSGERVTLTRDTPRANAPMSRFSAVYTGTGESVPGLSAADCGEVLTGVPREVYERSAFIRQNGLAVDSSAKLERRISTLISSGEEGVSYTEAEAALRRQLNARRHNKTGRIPTLDAEIAELARSLDELRTLAAERKNAEARLAAAEEEGVRLRAAIRLHDLADAQTQAKAAWQNADRQAEIFYRLLCANKVPPRESLEQTRSELATLTALKRGADDAARQRDDAQSALDAFDVAPVKRPGLLLPCIMISAAALLFFILTHALPNAAAWIGRAVSAAALLSLLISDAVRTGKARSKHKAQREALTQAFAQAQAKAEVQQELCHQTAQELQRRIPAAYHANAAAYIDANLARWDKFDALTREAQTTQIHYEALSRQCGSLDPASVEHPAESRETLQAHLSACEAQKQEAQRLIDQLLGQSRALGDRTELEARLAEKEQERDALQAEYDAIALALNALSRANAAMQSRFSPALGRRAAELLTRMTDGRYRAVLLDRAFQASAEEADSPVARSVSALSQGAADQLYLALRLAICELVLPEEKHVPLVLDDALTNFDDARCATALELLLEISRERQIILLTCQHREAACLAGRDGVHVLAL